MMSKTFFLDEYNLTDQDLTDSHQNWQSLSAVAEDHERNSKLLEEVGKSVMDQLLHARDVHTVRMRVKSKSKLVRKIVRKCRENPSRVITHENYQQEITDLVGIRALHLFKEDWRSVHDSLSDEWEMVGSPVAYIRKGDPQSWQEQFEDRGCFVQEHPRAYRSVHYLLRAGDSKRTIVEVQVRTLIEEAWSEIDHRINYPESNDSSAVRVFLGMFNRLAGNADEMGSFVNLLLVGELRRRADLVSTRKKERDYILERVRTIVRELPIGAEQRYELEQQFQTLHRQVTESPIASIAASDLLGGASSLESALRAAEYISQAATPIQLSDILRELQI